MGMQLSNKRVLRRAARLRRSFAISSFTIFLVGFGLCYWIFHMFTIVTAIECEYAVIWIAGWFGFRSAFQWLAVAVGACAVIWAARVILIRGLNSIETIAQLVLIFGLAGAFAAQKAYLFPYATPSREQVERVVSVFTPNRTALAEAPATDINVQDNWIYDYPPPPFAQSPVPPRRNGNINLRLDEIFKDKRSPLHSEYARMEKCYADYRSAVRQYEEDIKVWDDYWEGFNAWYAFNRWRYDGKH